MHNYVVKQPIKTKDNVLVGNEIVFDVESEIYNQNNDYSAAEAISTFLTQNSDKIDKSILNFITFTPNLLFKNMPKMFQKGELVIQIEDQVITNPFAQKLAQRYREQGYQIAINDFLFQPRYFGFLEYTDYIKINVKALEGNQVDNILRMGKGFGKKCIATNIDSKEVYDFARKYDFDLFEGPFVAEAAIIKEEKMQYLKSNFFQLVMAVTKDIPDVDEIQDIIERDAVLTYRLLRIVNSAHFALRYRTASVKQAIVVLGLEQLKKWVYLLSFDKDQENESEDVLKISLLRATFCSELVGMAEEMPITKSEAYLMGMLSTMTLMVDAPMEELLQNVPLDDVMREALIEHKGRCGTLLKLVYSYERAEWDSLNQYVKELGIPANSIAQVYFDCVENVNQLWNSLKDARFEEEEMSEQELKETLM